MELKQVEQERRTYKQFKKREAKALGQAVKEFGSYPNWNWGDTKRAEFWKRVVELSGEEPGPNPDKWDLTMYYIFKSKKQHIKRLHISTAASLFGDPEYKFYYPPHLDPIKDYFVWQNKERGIIELTERGYDELKRRANKEFQKEEAKELFEDPDEKPGQQDLCREINQNTTEST